MASNIESSGRKGTLLVGSFTHALDAKRRIIFPSVWRHAAGETNQLYAFPHPEQRCLYLYVADEMMRRLDRLRESGAIDRNDEQAVRSITAGADMPTWDAQGRVRIGDHLLRHAEVREKVVLIGTLTRVECWSVEHFDMALPQASAVAEQAFFGGY